MQINKKKVNNYSFNYSLLVNIYSKLFKTLIRFIHIIFQTKIEMNLPKKIGVFFS
jgi:hypothetical protein